MAATFKDLQKRRKVRGCPVCGSKNAVAVTVRITMLNETGQPLGGSGSTVSVSTSYCEEHGVDQFDFLRKTLGKEE